MNAIEPTKKEKIITILSVLRNTPESAIKLLTLKKNVSITKAYNYYDRMRSQDLTDNYNLAVAHIKIEQSKGLSAGAETLFRAYARDAHNWSGQPLVGGNVTSNKQTDGYLTALKKAELITTFTDEGNVWIQFTEKGHALAKKMGEDLSAYYERDEIKPIEPGEQVISPFYALCRNKAEIDFSVSWTPEVLLQKINDLANGRSMDWREVIGILVDIKKGITNAMAAAEKNKKVDEGNERFIRVINAEIKEGTSKDIDMALGRTMSQKSESWKMRPGR